MMSAKPVCLNAREDANKSVITQQVQMYVGARQLLKAMAVVLVKKRNKTKTCCNAEFTFAFIRYAPLFPYQLLGPKYSRTSYPMRKVSTSAIGTKRAVRFGQALQ